MLYQMMSGMLPEWQGGRLVPHEIMGRYPWELRDLVSRMLARTPAGREASFEHIMTELEAIQARFDRTVMAKGNGDERGSVLQDGNGRGVGKAGVWRLIWIFVVLAIVSAAASAYLIQAGFVKKYAALVAAIFQKFGIALP